jgi:hypothetical protein
VLDRGGDARGLTRGATDQTDELLAVNLALVEVWERRREPVPHL